MAGLRDARDVISTPLTVSPTAIALYRKRDPQHRNMARSLNNMAYVKRLIALQLRRKIDAEAARRRKAATRGVLETDKASCHIAVVLSNFIRRRWRNLVKRRQSTSSIGIIMDWAACT